MDAHPHADIFPVMSEAEFRSLKADIAANGLLDPIIIYEDQILDGRHRARACAELGIEPDAEIYEGADPLGFAVSRNLHRRHLDATQRAMIGARLANMRQGARTDLSSDDGRSRSAAAAALNVGTASIDRARVVIDHGVPELVAACDAGTMTVSVAAQMARLEPEVQLAILRNERPAMEPANTPEPDPIPARLMPDDPEKFHETGMISIKVLNAMQAIEKLIDPVEAAGVFRWPDQYPADQFRRAGEWFLAFAEALKTEAKS